MKNQIDKQLVDKAEKWLGKDGIKFFRDVHAKHGTIATACWMEGPIPHPIHFREGMQVRNWLRSNSDWDFDRLENHWDDLILAVLERSQEPKSEPDQEKDEKKVEAKPFLQNDHQCIACAGVQDDSDFDYCRACGYTKKQK